MNMTDTPVSTSMVPQAGGVRPSNEMQAGVADQSGRSGCLDSFVNENGPLVFAAVRPTWTPCAVST